MNRTAATNKTGRLACVIKKLEQKGKRYASKAERVNFHDSCRFYKIADDAFETAKRLSDEIRVPIR